MNERLYQYAGSLIALQRQADELEEMLRQGVQCWAGHPCRAALASTLQAIATDSTAALALSGPGEGDRQWLHAKLDWAQDKLREHGLEQADAGLLKT
jgi:hypothetical protein